jgi:hypothetical protein
MTSFPFKRAEIIDLIFDWKGTKPDNTLDIVDINHIDSDGNTALHVAAFNGLLACVERLVNRGANMSILNVDNLTCSDIADRGGNFPVASMLELAKIYHPPDELKEVTQMYHKFTKEVPNARIILDTKSITLAGLIEFIDEVIKIASHELNETAARAEVLLNTFNWIFKALKKDYTQNLSATLTLAKIKPRTAASTKG